MRTVNGTATQVDYHAHSDNGAGTIPWAQVLKFDNDQRPIGYIASGSHGFWAKPGTFTYVNAVIFKLQDKTSDKGVKWDTRDSLVTLNYPDTFSGDLSWLNFKGFWGNKGTTDCWWHFIYSDVSVSAQVMRDVDVSKCELSTGPDGPLRPDVLGAAFTKAKSSFSKSLAFSVRLHTWPLYTLTARSRLPSSTRVSRCGTDIGGAPTEALP